MSERKVYYFGCIDRPGHYMHSPGPYSLEKARADYRFMDTNPWGNKIDCGLCPPGDETEGRALVHHKDGWTALSFWDRSIDRRGKCNSNFLAEGTFTFAEMVELARRHFPKVMARFQFPIAEHTP